MKTFNQFITECFDLLTEDRIDTLKEKFKNKLDTTHDHLAKHKDSDAIVDHFAQNADPTVSKQNTQWILDKYQKKQFRQEDAPRIHRALSNFESKKPLLEPAQRNIFSHKSLGDLEDTLSPHENTQYVSGKQQAKNIKRTGAEKIFDSPNVSVHHIKTKEAACFYGKNTKWCTASTDPETGEPDSSNMFDHYNEQGPLYVVTHKPTQKKYQIHFESGQVMNERDEPVEPQHLKNEMPELTKVGQFHEKSLHFMPHGKLLDAFRNIHTKPESMQREFINFSLDDYKPVHD